MSKLTYTRTITVEVTLANPAGKGEMQCDRLGDYPVDEVLAQEKAMPLSEFFNNTDYTLIEDDMEIPSHEAGEGFSPKWHGTQVTAKGVIHFTDQVSKYPVT